MNSNAKSRPLDSYFKKIDKENTPQKSSAVTITDDPTPTPKEVFTPQPLTPTDDDDDSNVSELSESETSPRRCGSATTTTNLFNFVKNTMNKTKSQSSITDSPKEKKPSSGTVAAKDKTPKATPKSNQKTTQRSIVDLMRREADSLPPEPVNVDAEISSPSEDENNVDSDFDTIKKKPVLKINSSSSYSEDNDDISNHVKSDVESMPRSAQNQQGNRDLDDTQEEAEREISSVEEEREISTVEEIEIEISSVEGDISTVEEIERKISSVDEVERNISTVEEEEEEGGLSTIEEEKSTAEVESKCNGIITSPQDATIKHADIVSSALEKQDNLRVADVIDKAETRVADHTNKECAFSPDSDEDVFTVKINPAIEYADLVDIDLPLDKALACIDAIYQGDGSRAEKEEKIKLLARRNKNYLKTRRIKKRKRSPAGDGVTIFNIKKKIKKNHVSNKLYFTDESDRECTKKRVDSVLGSDKPVVKNKKRGRKSNKSKFSKNKENKIDKVPLHNIFIKNKSKEDKNKTNDEEAQKTTTINTSEDPIKIEISGSSESASNQTPTRKEEELPQRRSTRIKRSVRVLSIDSSESEEVNEKKKSKTALKEIKINPKNPEIASIFVKKAVEKPKKVEICPLKKAFLFSGIPEEFKKKIVKEKQEVHFYKSIRTYHVQQAGDDAMFHLRPVNVGGRTEAGREGGGVVAATPQPAVSDGSAESAVQFSWKRSGDVSFRKRSYERRKIKDMPVSMIKRSIEVIQEHCPELMAKSMYKSLLERFKDNKNGEAWSDKYAPNSKVSFIGNHDTKDKFYNWLKEWKLSMRERVVDQESDSDYIDDEMKLCNVAIVTGDTGIGKTSIVHGMAKHLGFKVFEVNPTSSRKGRDILARLHEATRSHHIKSSQDPLNFKKKKKKRENQQEDSEDEDDQTQNSLILFDETDIIFKEDKSFVTAINTFAADTKRPIIITLNRMIPDLPENADHFNLTPPSTALIAAYLEIICLVEKTKPLLSFVDLQLLVRRYHCDIRRCVNTLQYIIESGCSSNTFNFTKSMFSSSNNFKSMDSVYDILIEDMQMNDVDLLSRNIKTEEKVYTSSLQRMQNLALISDYLGHADIIRGGHMSCPATSRCYTELISCSERGSVQVENSDLSDIASWIERTSLSLDKRQVSDLKVVPMISQIVKNNDHNANRLEENRDILKSLNYQLVSNSVIAERVLRMSYAAYLNIIWRVEDSKLRLSLRKRHFLHYFNHTFDLDLLRRAAVGLSFAAVDQS